MTPYQRQHLSSLKAERDKRNSTHDSNWYIKFIRGSPVLAKKKHVNTSRAIKNINYKYSPNINCICREDFKLNVY